ncbi:hypothetical protein IT072_13375 [Leifsonia sp. ZF2019]|uniref:DUF6264 family protein n=1 Tax=Leifsonia sp. ZF2019 TaxID=2781978 RepID=UPI001CBE34CB|nr:DUF6264 family protein [Leifsonia sp. ZF2019]UAJ78256.1 hypothetical protein IT072_13375 [Leifsonia sp. ZF2019]
MADHEPQPDERPRPKFGELAPPGWVWTPPEDVDRLDTARPNPTAPDEATAPPSPAPYGSTPGPGHPSAGPHGATPGTTTPPRWNTTFTVLLIAFGFFGMAYSVVVLQGFPASMAILHSSQGLGDFHPEPLVGTLVTIGTLTMTGLWAVSTGLAVWQLLRRRMSFYIPLVAGIVAMVALFVFLAVILTTDPVLLDFYSGLMPASPAPSAPATP